MTFQCCSALACRLPDIVRRLFPTALVVPAVCQRPIDLESFEQNNGLVVATSAGLIPGICQDDWALGCSFVLRCGRTGRRVRSMRLPMQAQARPIIWLATCVATF